MNKELQEDVLALEKLRPKRDKFYHLSNVLLLARIPETTSYGNTFGRQCCLSRI